MKFGLIGLGNMGRALGEHALEEGIEVVAYNRTTSKAEDFVRSNPGVVTAKTLQDLVNNLESPRILWLMVSAGQPLKAIISELTPLLSKGDIVVNAVNSHYKDSQQDSEKLAKMGIHYLDVGTSGGLEGARSGACFMIGGPEEAFKAVEPLIKALAYEHKGYAYFGPSGSGHLVKMVHNGIEYAMMQSIAEGVNILDKHPLKPDLVKATEVWNQGSIIQSNLVGWLNKALSSDPDLKDTPAEVGSLGTGDWTVQEAMELGVPVPNIANAVFNRYQSRDKESIAYRIVQALRSQFGGHTSTERPQ
ncbi:MAG: decarboxylating 6-phosphogluconate dehydrogenase [bacterium]|nr:decarboxylating 6-phosphogluconate dehydrogenase [bacterium]